MWSADPSIAARRWIAGLERTDGRLRGEAPALVCGPPSESSSAAPARHPWSVAAVTTGDEMNAVAVSTGEAVERDASRRGPAILSLAVSPLGIRDAFEGR
jgi:hypothetical protein